MTISSPTVRAADPVDLAAVSALAVAFYTEDGFAIDEQELGNNLATLLASPAARVAVADSGDRLLGYAVTTTGFGLENGLIAVLDDLFVVPTARQCGLAGRLIEDSSEWARERGCPCLELVVAPNGRDVGHLFAYYLARGFHDDGRRLLSKRL
ncbi:GNAT family N-acetyltransferase [Nocardia aurantiaca]|uniref:GNAT family N-acetyltransferase n=1 Tax=Nocardia aurantiaca TaxID=2675850 RepID=A0A6I3KXF2_9NOCA|nr:GNAT family N-acetyltransferase [Nocardia aurantiaca]MTE13356.1 GNAT family N-acetyltransferase [Nocardia aurantiaca]